jgi:hypothetical protein
LNSFPQRAGNHDLLLRTFENALDGFTDEIICDTARKFVCGLVEGQSLTFAPSVAEFVKAARDLIEVRKAGTLTYRGEELPREPINAKIARVRAQYANRQLIQDGISFDKWLEFSRKKNLPPNCEFVALLGAIYAA